jgi:dipeptidyl aminopeptidase/acylaminoacyl peptidase
MLVGSLLVGSSTGAPAEFDTSGVHVSDHRWLDASTILFIGLRGQETVMGALDPSSGEVDELWTSHQTTGRYQPELGGWSARGPLIAVEDHHHPPALAVVSAGSSDIVLRASGRGLDHLVAHAGRRSALSWEAGDGTLIQGYLTLPDRPAPHPLVVDVHGGPIGAVRNTWAGRDPYLSVLVARGYAVLQPNPRGSTGRGAAFAQAVVGDMGGTDVDDILTGVRLLVEDGVADGERLGITGVSYGGYMSAWIPCLTQMFKAGVSRSPCTDWVLMYLTSNIGEFVRIFVDGDPSDPDSQYRTRSPLQQADRIRTPLLFTAGLRDLACPPSQAHTMYSALVQRGVDAGLVVYPEEGHDVKRHEALIDQCARLVEWFERYLPAQSG